MNAQSDIKEGSIWWKSIIGKNIIQLTRGQWKTFRNSELHKSKSSNAIYSVLITSTYYDNDTDCLNFVCDSTRFIRHSTSPNSRLSKEGRIALKDIKEGEEITENFLEYDKYPWPELWEGPIEMHGDESVKKAYLVDHPADLDVTTEFMEKTKLYIGDAGELGLGGFVGVAQKKGAVYHRDYPWNIWNVPQEPYLSFVNSKRSDLCQRFIDAILMHSYYVKKIDSLEIYLDNSRFVNHGIPGHVVYTNHQMTFVADIGANEHMLEDYNTNDGICLPCPWAKFPWEFLITRKY